MILSSQEIADKYNFNKAIFPGIQGGPLMHVIAAKAVCFKFSTVCVVPPVALPLPAALLFPAAAASTDLP